MNREWVVEIRDQCIAAGMPFFFKQWGGTNKKKPAACSTAAPGMKFRRLSDINERAPNGTPSRSPLRAIQLHKQLFKLH
jgi:hypothetical protein